MSRAAVLAPAADHAPPRKPGRAGDGWRRALPRVVLCGALAYLLGYGALRATGFFFVERRWTSRPRVVSDLTPRVVSGELALRRPPGSTRPSEVTQRIHEFLGHLYGSLRDVEVWWLRA